MKNKQRFQITPVTEEDSASVGSYGSFRGQDPLGLVTPTNVRRNSRTVPALPSEQDRRKYSLAQLTR